MRRKIGITGGAGFLGVNLTDLAVERGYDVVTMDVGDRLGRLAHRSGETQITRRDLDLTRPDASLPDDLDFIVHLAALPHVDYSLHHPERVLANNIAAHTPVMAAARRHDIPVLFTSSIEVYGGNGGDLFVEDDPADPQSPYAASKIGCEHIAASYRLNYGCSITTVRLTNLYGPWQAPDRIVPRLLTQGIIGGCEREVATGRWRDFLYVADAAAAILALVESDEWGGTYNVSTGNGIDLVEVAETIDADVGGQTRRIDCPVSDGRGSSLVAASERLQRTVDWKPETALADGIEATLGWYRENEAWWSRFEPQIRADRTGPQFILDHAHPISR
ncbi:GDP-mannose 4,6-dehydratase [Streptomyces sp. ME02-6979.5a]|uniref:NAD-dependent epimerase/dehydratase family protein n=1 Tax=Streptomyces sp. ME02-6979.5a TaxID=462925 RepID=UPI0029A522E9|nr:NAD-dependent epimerase/dehydratase family protein [Streptomyces sp. ME02-6979.5a]MDX3339691.1 GDP-mannose 4,6-dehydratase [Streptomyces sp. ME02-6979.5a]